MPTRFPCPNCGAAYAYSPALLGRTYQCRQCHELFGVTEPPPTEVPVVASAGAARAPLPPPLPPRLSSARLDSTDRDNRPSGPPEPDEHRRRPGINPDRPTGVGALIGLLVAFFVGFFVLLGGVIYMLWPGSTPAAAVTEGPPPPNPVPFVVEPPKKLDDILKEAPGKETRDLGRPPAARFETPVPGGPVPGGPVPPPGPFGPPPGFRPPGRMMPDGFLPPGFGPPGIVPPFGPPDVGVVPPGAFPPGFPPARGPFPPVPALGPPRFAEVVPLPIRPTRLDRPREEIALPGPVESAAVAAGGRLLLLHVPKAQKVVVFDVDEGKVVKQIDAPDPGTLLAGGMNTFVVYQPKPNTFDRWACDKLEKLPEVRSPFTDPVRALAMGSATNGPLVAALGGARGTRPRGATLAYFDPIAAREVYYQSDGRPSPIGIGPADAPVRLRVGANGQVMTAGSPTRPLGTEVTIIRGGRATRDWEIGSPPFLVPSADGKRLGGFGKMFALDRPEWRLPAVSLGVFNLPAVSGPWYLALTDTDPTGLPQRFRPTAAKLCDPERPAAGADLGRLEEVDFAGAHAGDIDQRVFLVPPAHVLITVAAPKWDRLILRRAELK